MTTSMDPAVLQNFGSSNPWQFWNLPHSSTKKKLKNWSSCFEHNIDIEIQDFVIDVFHFIYDLQVSFAH